MACSSQMFTGQEFIMQHQNLTEKEPSAVLLFLKALVS